MIRRILHPIAHSLSARLLGIFLLTALLFTASRRAMPWTWFWTATICVRWSAGHISLHTTYLLRDLGSPPSIERARAISESNSMDIRIQGPDVDWSSDPNFPDASEMCSSRPVISLSIASKPGIFESSEDGNARLEDVGFARYKDHSLRENRYRRIPRSCWPRRRFRSFPGRPCPLRLSLSASPYSCWPGVSLP